ncbi:TlyA family RNA methyltransferase [Phycicoccus sp.]|uniref:TlyA family RNA methyltransferase n=1 Tax=Phycicoccus sp. TaxID=1902410 RepID=UPI002D0391C2|nr:TlyA family RNA methyltransferase [Phycicoccus sp.]HMM96020.1 TlyA family RNA methyltransferase [Phycicoccus sp.]
MGRLDTELVRRGLARSRGEARDLVAGGHVRVGGRTAGKPSQPVGPDTPLEVDAAAPRWVGRAAHKLLAALSTWGPQGLVVEGRRCIDVGASTGGFTEVLLAHGAAHVVAVDVGHDQLVPALAADPRVEDRAGTSIRGLAAADVGGPADLVVADLSFISLTLVATELAGLLAPGGDLVVLVKPQFEVGRARLGRGGLVTSAEDRATAVEAVLGAFLGVGLHTHGVAASPIAGSTGNAEYLLWARSDPSDTMNAQQAGALVREVTHATPGGAR